MVVSTLVSNAATGNDFNDGATAGTALRTTEELSRRLAVSVPIDHPVTVHIAQGSYGTLAVRVIQSALACPFDVVGEVSYTDIGTVTSYTAENLATDTEPLLVASGVTDWTAHIGKRVDVLTGANAGAVTWVGKVNPHGVGASTAGILTPLLPIGATAAYLSPSVASLAGGDPVAVAQLPSIQLLSIHVEARTPLDTAGIYGALPYRVLNLHCDEIRTSDTEGLVDGCSVGSISGLGRAASGQLSFGLVTRSRLCGMPGSAGYQWLSRTAVGLLVLGPTTLFVTEGQIFRCLVYGVSAIFLDGGATLALAGVFDRPGSATTAAIRPFDTRLGRMTLNGVYGRDNAGFAVSVPKATMVLAYSCTITGAAGSVRANTMAIPWTSLPWRDGERSGEATLVAGTVDVTVPYVLATQKITACAKTFSGAPGFLRAAYVDATTIRITSSSATDTSVITWHILPVGDNAVIRS